MTQAEYRRPRSSGRGKMLVVALLVLVLCLACFALGIMVGGSDSDDSALQTAEETSSPASVRATAETRATVSDSKRGAAEDLRSSHKSAQEQEPESGAQRAEDKTLDPKEDSAGGDTLQAEVETAQDVPLGSGINPREKPQDASAPATESAQTSAPEDGVTAAVKTTSARTLEKKPDSRPEPASEVKPEAGKYVVQIASFRADKDASALAQKLRPEFPTYVREVDLNEKGTWYRVLVGPIAQRAEADELKRRIKQSAGLEGFVKKAP